ncbi:ABC transporter ATP-binding protein [Corynebacterium alimapuense]|nr:ATP-binding cassette domain-containing protein [Corynebacterium alimapuense]
MTTVLELTNTQLIYPDGDGHVTALDHVNMKAESGQMIAVVGESGSGKSSLLSVAAGLLSPTSGSVRIAGMAFHDATEAQRCRIRRERIGIVFQQANLLGSLKVRDQLLITDHLRGLRGKALRQRHTHAEELLERVGLAGLGERKINQLSGGQRQRVNIARALMGEPVLVLADEPTASLDRQLSCEIVDLLRELTDDTGVATVMVTHDRSLLDAFDSVLEVRDGRVSVGSSRPLSR